MRAFEITHRLTGRRLCPLIMAPDKEAAWWTAVDEHDIRPEDINVIEARLAWPTHVRKDRRIHVAITEDGRIVLETMREDEVQNGLFAIREQGGTYSVHTAHFDPEGNWVASTLCRVPVYVPKAPPGTIPQVRLLGRLPCLSS